MTTRVLGTMHERWFEQRGISPETATRYEVYTGKCVKAVDAKGQERTDVVPDANGNVLVFPLFDRGVQVNEKYRAPGKRFWQRSGGRKTFWNADVLDDPALADGRHALIITEGEPDALTAIDCGFPFTVSVPDGAPPVKEGEDPEALGPLDMQQDGAGKFEFLWNNRDRLKRIKRFIIATDNDGPGKRLAAELVRRLLPSCCLFITYPNEAVVPDRAAKRPCKDLNEVRVHFGPEAVASVLNAAKPYPVKGLYRLFEFPDLPPITTVSTGLWTLDRHLRPFLGELMFVLGIPSHGKSALVAHLLVNWAEVYGWRAAVFSPEEPVVPHFRDKLRRVRLRRAPYDLDRAMIARTDEWINETFCFICADPSGRQDDSDELTLEWIIDRAQDAVLRDGVRVLVIDPWNECEHARLRGESTTEYTARAIRMLNRFRHQYDVMVIVLIHPTKEVGKEGKSRPPTPYDADGSAAFYNKADHFLTIYRADETRDEAIVRVAKVKFEGTGEKGKVTLSFDRSSGRFDVLNHVAADRLEVE
jgi:twinkle protein